jgi:tetratricopeptide (TPR) repeat protein
LKHGNNQDLQLAFSLHRAGRFNEAAGLYRKIIKRNPKNFHALQSLGIIEASNGNLGEAASLMARSLSIQPPNPQFFENYATVLCQMGAYKAALEVCRKGLRSDNRNVALLYVSATSLVLLGQLPEALEQFDKLLSVKGDHLPAIGLRRYDEAIAAYDRALAIEPGLVEALLHRGNCLREMERHEEALDAYKRVVSLKPDVVPAWFACGALFTKLFRHAEAATAYAQVLKIDPQYPLTKGLLLHQRMLCCDWEGMDEAIADIDGDLASGKLSIDPFGWQGLARSERSLQIRAELYNSTNFPAEVKSPSLRTSVKHDKVRIGYLCGELREQATSHLLVGVLERHDSSRFEAMALTAGGTIKATCAGASRPHCIV